MVLLEERLGDFGVLMISFDFWMDGFSCSKEIRRKKNPDDFGQ